jgi:hypothetical protein
MAMARAWSKNDKWGLTAFMLGRSADAYGDNTPFQTDKSLFPLLRAFEMGIACVGQMGDGG